MIERLSQKKLTNGIFELVYKGRIFLMNVYPIRIIEIDSIIESHELTSEVLKYLRKDSDGDSMEEFRGFGAIEFIATTRCNLRCTHCTARAFDNPNESYYGMPAMDMPLETMYAAIDAAIDQLLDRLEKQPSQTVNFEMFITGGEPLLVWNDLSKSIDYAKNKLQKISNISEFNFTPHVVTNGLLINEIIAEDLKRQNVVVTIALDSPFNEVRVDSNGNPGTPLALKGLKQLMKVGHKRTSINVVVPGEKINSIDKIFDYLEKFDAFKGITTIQLSALAPPIQHTRFAGKGLSAKYVNGYHDVNNCSIFSEKLINYSEKYDLDMKLYASKLASWLQQGGTKYRCPVAEWKWCVAPDGYIYACHQLVGIGKFKMGYLFENNWYYDKMSMSIRNQFLKRTVFEANLCQDCVLVTSCMVFVDCPARSYLEEGDIKKVPLHYCLCGKTYLEKLLGEHIISLIDTGCTSKHPAIK